MTTAKKVFFYILKITVLVLLFYPAYALAVYGAIGLNADLGYFALVLIPLVAFAYLKFALWLIKLGATDEQKNENKLKRFLSALSVIIPSVLMGIIIVFPDYTSRFFEIRRFDIYCSRADEFIAVDYPLEKAKDRGFLRMDTPFSQPAFIIDLDAKRVLFDSGRWEFMSYELSKDVPPFSDLDVQSEKSLSSPGKAFRTYSDKSQSAFPYITYGIEIELENGEVWRTKTEQLFFDIDNAFPLIYEAVQRCDEKIEYSDTEIPMNGANISHPSILLDYDDMYAYIVYYNFSGFEFYYYSFKLTEYGDEFNDIPEMNIIAKIETESSWKEVYICYRNDRELRNTLGFAVLSEDGKWYFGQKSVPRLDVSDIKESRYAFSGRLSDILNWHNVS